MPVFGVPAFLLAGVLAALVPLALHLLRQRPAARQPLPTARFLSPEPRSRLRLAAPDAPLLLALRMLLMMLVGAALALPGWLPRARGSGEVVLLDLAAAADPAAWRRAVDAAERVAAGTPTALVLFDTAVRVLSPAELTPESFAALRRAAPAARSSRLTAGLGAARAAAAGLAGADSLRLWLVSPAAAASWTPGTAALREAAWPGGVRLVDVQATGAPTGGGAPAARSARVVARDGEGGFVRAALEAAGYTLTDGMADVVVRLSPDAGGAAAAAGGVLLRDAGAVRGERIPGVGVLRLSDGRSIAGAEGRILLAADGPVVAAWDDGRPAAVVRRAGAGCEVRFGAALERGDLPLGAAFPHLLDHLLGSCVPAEPPVGSLDAGAREILRGTGPEWVPASAVGGARPVPLTRWVAGLALLVALLEVPLARRRRSP